MKWLNNILSRRSAETAKDRLRIVIAQERSTGTAGAQPDFLPLLHKEILALIKKYTDINSDNVEVDVTHHEKSAVLKLNVVLNKNKKLKQQVEAEV